MTDTDWTAQAIQQLRDKFIEDEDHWIAYFISGDLRIALYEDKREWYAFLISQEGYDSNNTRLS